MNKIFIGLIFILIVFVTAEKQVTVERPINLNCLDIEFFPCNLNDSIIELDCASLKKYSETQMVIEHLKIKYIWENNFLYRADKNLGCYKVVCIKYDNGYDILGKNN